MRTVLYTLILSLFLSACATTPEVSDPVTANRFSIAVIPDTQNYVDYKHQKEHGFALDSSELFIQQMQYIASRGQPNGGDIVFVAAVGDVWQHQTIAMDDDHSQRGFKAIHNPYFATEVETTAKTLSVEIPKAIEGYKIIHRSGLPFGVAPGNHDYDAMWSVGNFPPKLGVPFSEITMTAEDLGLMHIGGLDNFRSAFGDDTDFFKNKAWYVDSFRGGANSAQVFSAGGYRFLHFAIEMQAGNDVLEWATSVMQRYRGLPTLVSTHDYLDAMGERQANPIIDLKRADPEFHNTAEELWQKFISQNDQIFLVLCGHHHGQSHRVDKNKFGHEVYQVLADYQDRGQVGIEQGQPVNPRTGWKVGIGDGWFRLMEFDLAAAIPKLRVKTYSSYYSKYSAQLSTYAQWYREHEQPNMSDEEFYAADEFTLELKDFHQRFGRK